MTQDKKRITVRLPEPMNLKLELEAKKLGISKNALIITILNESLCNQNDVIVD